MTAGTDTELDAHSDRGSPDSADIIPEPDVRLSMLVGPARDTAPNTSNADTEDLTSGSQYLLGNKLREDSPAAEDQRSSTDPFSSVESETNVQVNCRPSCFWSR